MTAAAPLLRLTAALRRPFVVRGRSMLPTLRDGDLLQVIPHQPAAFREPPFPEPRSRRTPSRRTPSRRTPSRRTPSRQLRRGQLVIARLPNAPQRTVVKRIIALPGEYIRPDADGRITINDTPLPEPYLHPAAAPGLPLLSPSPDAAHFPAGLCGDDEYFLLGDNRALRESADSRRYGPAPASDIIGIVWFRWPRLPLRLPLSLRLPLRRPDPRRASPRPPPASSLPLPPAPAQE